MTVSFAIAVAVVAFLTGVAVGLAYTVILARRTTTIDRIAADLTDTVAAATLPTHDGPAGPYPPTVSHRDVVAFAVRHDLDLGQATAELHRLRIRALVDREVRR